MITAQTAGATTSMGVIFFKKSTWPVAASSSAANRLINTPFTPFRMPPAASEWGGHISLSHNSNYGSDKVYWLTMSGALALSCR